MSSTEFVDLEIRRLPYTDTDNIDVDDPFPGVVLASDGEESILQFGDIEVTYVYEGLDSGNLDRITRQEILQFATSDYWYKLRNIRIFNRATSEIIDFSQIIQMHNVYFLRGNNQRDLSFYVQEVDAVFVTESLGYLDGLIAILHELGHLEDPEVQQSIISTRERNYALRTLSADYMKFPVSERVIGAILRQEVNAWLWAITRLEPLMRSSSHENRSNFIVGYMLQKLRTYQDAMTAKVNNGAVTEEPVHDELVEYLLGPIRS